MNPFSPGPNCQSNTCDLLNGYDMMVLNHNVYPLGVDDFCGSYEVKCVGTWTIGYHCTQKGSVSVDYLPKKGGAGAGSYDLSLSYDFASSP